MYDTKISFLETIYMKDEFDVTDKIKELSDLIHLYKLC